MVTAVNVRSARRYTPGVSLLLAALFCLFLGGSVIYLLRPLYYSLAASVFSSYRPEKLSASLLGASPRIGCCLLSV